MLLCLSFAHFAALLNLLSILFVPDEKSWKAEAEIDMELFHQVLKHNKAGFISTPIDEIAVANELRWYMQPF